MAGAGNSAEGEGSEKAQRRGGAGARTLAERGDGEEELPGRRQEQRVSAGGKLGSFTQALGQVL